jgi:hypothetical protein
MVSARTTGIIFGGLVVGWLFSEVIQLMPGIRRTSVMGSSQAPSPPATPADVGTNVADPRPASIVRPVRRVTTRPGARVTTVQPTAAESSIQSHEATRTRQTAATDAAGVSSDPEDPRQVIDWLLRRSSND